MTPIEIPVSLMKSIIKNSLLNNADGVGEWHKFKAIGKNVILRVKA